MKVLSIQDITINVDTKIYADPSKCNHTDALNVYKRLFDDYNQKKNTDYNSFFWGFSKLRTSDLENSIKRAIEMIGIDCSRRWKVFVLDIPDELCLETDFYNFTDEIFAYLYPKELDSHWEYIYEQRDSERQVIFPYMCQDWVMLEKII